jgi:putative transposase
VALVLEQGYTVPIAAASLGIKDTLLYNWKAKFEAEQSGVALDVDERLCNESFKVSDYGVQKLMAKLGLVVTQRVAYKATTKRKHSDALADNLLNMNFNPVGPN